jgi:serralysin
MAMPVTGEAAGDTFDSIEMISGSQFNDTITGNDDTNWLFGNDGDDMLIGGGGHDALFGGTGADALIGGAGVDNAQYSQSSSGVTVDLVNSSSNAGEAAGDTYSSIEMVSGSHFNDNIYGDNNRNFLYANRGNDAIDGRGGNDTISGGDGNDIMTGGLGADTFVWASDDTGIAVSHPNSLKYATVRSSPSSSGTAGSQSSFPLASEISG